jgi:predicted cupin superfamily sugar epimerase
MNHPPTLPDVATLVRTLQLRPHPEGGYYRETYRSGRLDDDGRAASTLIYFLLPAGHVSRLHRIDADESWHLYLGGPLQVFELDERDPDGAPTVTVLGTDLARGERLQHVVPAGRWFGAAPVDGAPYALVGCAVAPAFEFDRFELGARPDLLRRFPGARAIVERLTDDD